MRGVYNLNYEIAGFTTAETLAMITAAATHVLELIEVHVTNSNNAISAQIGVALQRISVVGGAAGANLKTSNVIPDDVGDQATAVTTAIGNLTVEPTTYTSVIDQQGVNNLAGYHYVPLPEDRPTIPPGGSVGLRMLSNLTSSNIEVQMIWREIG